jgi:hypothetical protein
MKEAMDKIRIVSMGIEGGGETIYAQKVDGMWSFWSEVSAMDLDKNDDEIWRGFSSDPVPTLSEILDGIWWKMYPIEINPEFREQLRQEYKRCYRAPLDEFSESLKNHFHENHDVWMKLLYGEEVSVRQLIGRGLI